jgi:hypothetical protein
MDEIKVRREGNEMVYEMRVKIGEGSMLEQEQAIQDAVNRVGGRATADALKRFDTQGKAISVDGVKFTTKGEQTEEYECPFGKIVVARHVYQNANGGRTFCPMEHGARLILNSTPKYAKLLSHHYGKGGALSVAEDLKETTGRIVCPAYVKNVSEVVANCAQIFELDVVYDLPDNLDEVAQVVISLDGTCMLMIDDGWREAMTGTISLYDSAGVRMHTIYIGATPQYGKAEFLARFEREIANVKTLYPHAVYIGLADGARANWDFLRQWTNRLILDFYHASEYVAKAANAMFPGVGKAPLKQQWLTRTLHNLKHKHGAAKRLLNEMEEALEQVPKSRKHEMTAAITYFSNNYHKMNYARQSKVDMPIGSGVVEAACKELIKHRLAGSGMRWNNHGAGIVISIRSLILSSKRWEQFWSKIDQSGCPAHKEFITL